MSAYKYHNINHGSNCDRTRPTISCAQSRQHTIHPTCREWLAIVSLARCCRAYRFMQISEEKTKKKKHKKNMSAIAVWFTNLHFGSTRSWTAVPRWVRARCAAATAASSSAFCCLYAHKLDFNRVSWWLHATHTLSRFICLLWYIFYIL